MYYCKICGSKNIRLKKIKYTVLESEDDEISGGLPVIKGKLSSSFGTVKEVEEEDYCCNLCLNERVQTTFEPEYLLEDGTDRQLINISENLNNSLSRLEVTKNSLVNMLKENEEQFERTLALYLQHGRNTCKDYRVGDRIVLKVPKIGSMSIWVIIEMINGREVYHLSFGGGDINCR